MADRTHAILDHRSFSRFSALGTITAITMALMVVGVVGCGSTRSAAEPTRARAQDVAGEVSSLLAGIPQHGNTLGDTRAPLTVQYFGDLECPFCGRFTLGPLRSLIQNYVRRGKLKIEYRSLETATHDPETFRIQQVAALAAGEQNRLWNFIELFYHEQGRENSGYVTESYLQGLAQRVTGLKLIAWTAARNHRRLVNTLESDAQAAAAAGLRQTPSFRIGKTVGEPTPYAATIEKLLKGEPSA
jgi:protein-disulfide isomerase